jgi:oligopeptidase A
MAVKPFLDSEFHIRWSRLQPELIQPAIRDAIRRAQQAIGEIAGRDPGKLDFANTFQALEVATEELSVAWGKVSHLQSVADSPVLRAAHNAMLPEVSAFFAGVPLNEALWRRLKTFADSAAGRELTGVRRRFVDETVRDFRQAGADLAVTARARLEALQRELAQVTQKYSENVLDATNGWQVVIEDEARLAGLPERARAAARRSAESKGLAGWRFTLHQPSQEPFMLYLDDDSLRQEMWTAATGVGAREPFDNTGLIQRILTLRAEKAALLGKPHFADLILERRMAKSGRRAREFIEDLHGRAAAAFGTECRELEEFKAMRTNTATGQLAPWEISYWAEKLRQERYHLDQEALRPYFPMDRVIGGMFELVGKVFGLRVAERPAGEVETWHPDVRYYDLFTRSGRHAGSFYTDWHPRESKRGGAWMNYLITGGPILEKECHAPHLGLICGNLTPPAKDRPALLTHHEVETIFHEFGHLLHHLLGEVEIKSLNGVNVAWDFVELPSQIMENWCWEREGLELFAAHHETGERLPEEIFSRMVAARNFRAACAMMRQVAFARMDLELHTRTAEYAALPDVEPAVAAVISDCTLPSSPPAPTLVKRFTHIFADPVGYAAGYYSYKWAEVLDADAFTRFKQAGVFNASVGAEFVTTILSRGNAEEPEVLYRAFMGREPDWHALLQRCGLEPAA